MISNDDVYLVKLKGAGFPVAFIAARMGISIQEVERRWEAIQKASTAAQTSGYLDLSAQFTVMCHQYQLVGESLKIIAGALHNQASAEEIRTALCCAEPLSQEQADAIQQKLLTSYIVLRPFTPVDPEKALQETTKQIQKGN